MKILLILSVLGLGLACSSPPPAEEPVVPLPVAPPPPPPPPVVDTTPQKAPEKATVAISDRIRAACGIADSDTLFAYDSANISGSARTLLKKLADCFTTGPLKGSKMRLIGHADPRGDEEYNLSLGGRRADNVKRGLVQMGLNTGSATSTSRGEMDATGSDASGWARDRKVEVRLAD